MGKKFVLLEKFHIEAGELRLLVNLISDIFDTDRVNLLESRNIVVGLLFVVDELGIEYPCPPDSLYLNLPVDVARFHQVWRGEIRLTLSLETENK